MQQIDTAIDYNEFNIDDDDLNFNKDELEKLYDYLWKNNPDKLKSLKSRIWELKDWVQVKLNNLKEVLEDSFNYWNFNKEFVNNSAEKIWIDNKTFIQILKKENSKAWPFLHPWNRHVKYENISDWTKEAYWLWQVTPWTFDTIFKYLKKENKYTDYNSAKEHYLWIWVDDNTMMKTQLDFSAAYIKMITDKHWTKDSLLTIWRVWMYYNAWINFEANNESDNVSNNRIWTNAVNSNMVVSRFWLKLWNMSKKEYADRMTYYYWEWKDVDVMARSDVKLWDIEEWKKIIEDLNPEIKERWKSVWWIWQLSITDVLWFMYWWLNLFWAAMDWFSWNWWDALTKWLIAYTWMKNISREVWWNLDDWKDKIENISEKYSDNTSDLKWILERIYNWEDWNTKEKLINNLLGEDDLDGKDRYKRLEKIWWIFKNKINFNEIQNVKWDITEENLWKIISKEDLKSITWDDLKSVANILDVLKILKVDNIDEFKWVMEYTIWNYSPSRFDKIRNLVDMI